MNEKGTADPGRSRFPRYLLAGWAGGTAAGFLTAYLESFFLLFTVGVFWVDFPFLIKALTLYGLAGGCAGAGCSLVLFFVIFHRRPMKDPHPWVIFFAFFSAGALILEVVVYLLDIHTFRNFNGGWAASAYLVLFLGFLAAVLVGWLVVVTCRSVLLGTTGRHLLKAATALSVFIAVFLLARAFTAWQENAAPGRLAVKDGIQPANVLILLVDALRPDHLSAYGYPLPTSPTIDRLAREGVLFRKCYATSTWTVPTHASLFTGLMPSAHGAYSLYSPMDPSVPTLSKILSGKGYRTGAFYDNPLLGSRYGLTRGFQTALGVDNGHKVSLMLPRIWERLRGGHSMSGNLLRTAGRWIEHSQSRKAPFLVFVNLLDAHLPYRPKKPYINEFMRSLPKENVNFDLARQLTADGVLSKKKADALYGKLSAADWRWLERFYDSNIRAIDERIGLFLNGLKSMGGLANTLVIVTADHGELFGENGLGGHYQLSMTQGALHIPLILWFPARLPSGEIRHPVSQVDIFQNVLKLAGFAAAVPRNAQGADLFTPSPDREFMAEFWDEGRKRFSRAFFSGDLKLVTLASGTRELYDLKNDPLEKDDLAPRHSDLLRSLASRLEERLRSMPKMSTGMDAQKNKEMEKLLKSLGYL